MRFLLSFRVSHLPLAKPLAQEVHQKRSSPSFLFARFWLTLHSYVSGLEDRLEKMQALLKRVRITRIR